MSDVPSKNPSRAKVTLLTIAKDLNVSRATVSNAYSRPRHVSPELREKIFRHAAELGYPGPHAGARALRTGKVSSVGLIFAEELRYAFVDPAITSFLEGLSTVLAEADLSLLVIPTGDESDESTVRQALLDGFILYSSPRSFDAVKAAIQRGLPTVCVDDPHIKGVPIISIDNRSAARAAADHLIGMGHRNLAVLVCQPSSEREVKVLTYKESLKAPFGVTGSRLRGYGDACEAHGISSPIVIQCTYNTIDSAHEAMTAVFPQINCPTGLLAASDLLALGALRFAKGVGLQVPRDISTVGFDDLSQATSVKPSLTTVSQPLVEKGLEAGRVLLGLLDGKAPTKLTTQLPWELVIRGTSGPSSG